MKPTITKKFEVDGDNFSLVGEASTQVKTLLKQIGFPPQLIRRVAIAMYEGEVNMAIHADGGTARADLYPDRVEILLDDKGPGIADIPLAMKEGYSTASEEARNMGFGAGMGLSNMKRNSDDMKIESTPGVGTKVHLTFNIDS